MKWTKQERGGALIEFSLLISLQLLLTLGVIDFALAVRNAMIISGAAQAGARFGASEGNSNDTSGMAAAALNAATGVNGMTATATFWCSCSAGGSTVSCATLCNTYDLPLQYVQVQTNTTMALLFRFPGIPLSIGLSGSATFRAR